MALEFQSMYSSKSEEVLLRTSNSENVLLC